MTGTTKIKIIWSHIKARIAQFTEYVLIPLRGQEVFTIHEGTLLKLVPFYQQGEDQVARRVLSGRSVQFEQAQLAGYLDLF